MSSYNRKRSRKPRKNPSTVVLVGGGAALLAAAVGAWWWMRSRTPDDRILLEEEGGGKRKFSPAKLQGAARIRPGVKALAAMQSPTQGAGQGAAQSTPAADTSASAGGIDQSQRGVAPSGPPPGAGSSSSYFYIPPTR
jgi:hypothetical protein